MDRAAFAETAPKVVKEYGWHVFPVCWATPDGKCGCGRGHKDKAIGKSPLTANGYLDATVDLAVIRRWTAQYPEANIGVALSKSGIGVVDCDSDAALHEADQIGTPPTAIVRTASGEHRYYRTDNCPHTRVTHWGESGSIDLLTDGFAIIPGSRHRSGHIYEWITTPSEVEIPQMPDLYVDVLDKAVENRKNTATNAPLEVVEIDAPGTLSPEGLEVWNGKSFVPSAQDQDKADRSATLFKLAGHLLDAGLDEDAAAGALAGWDALHGQKFSGRKNAARYYRQTVLRAMERMDHEILLDDPDNAADEKPAKRKVPSESQWRDLYLEKYKGTAFGRGEWMRYKNGLWSPITEYQVGHELSLLMGSFTTSKLVSAVMRLVKDKSARPDNIWDANANIIVMANGTFDLEKFELRPHSPIDYATNGVEYGYDPGAQCPSWMRYLTTEWQDGDRTVKMFNDEPGDDVRAFLQEFAGYSLTQETKYEIALWFVSPMGRGKSTFLAGLQAMLGPRCGELSLRRLNNQFGLDNMPGKTLMTSGEQPSGYMECLDLFNSMVSGEPITVEKKFKDSFTIRPIIKLCWAMNDEPRIAEPNNGIWRRIKIVHSPELPDRLKDPNLKDKILTEGPGIFNWALVGLKRLNERARWIGEDIPSSIRQAVEDFSTLSDIPKTFIQEECEPGEQFREGRQKLYNRYVEWCHMNGHKPKARRFITQDWVRLGLKGVSSSGKDYWKGVKLKERPVEEPDVTVEDTVEVLKGLQF